MATREPAHSPDRDGLVGLPREVLATRGRRVAAAVSGAVFVVATAGTGLVDTLDPLPYPNLAGEERREDAAVRAHARLADGSLAKLIEHELRLRSRTRKAVTAPYTLALLRWFGEVPGIVVVGRDGWLFNASYSVTALMTDEEIAGFTSSLFAALERRMRGMGIETLLLPVPRKSVVYGSRLPDHINARPELDRMFQDELARRGVAAVDLVTAFEGEHTAPLYYRADLHWTQTAELIAAEETCRAAGILVPEEARATRVRRVARTRFEQTKTLESLGIETDDATLRSLGVPEGQYFEVFRGKKRFPARYENPPTMTRLAIVGTSFTAQRKLNHFLSHFSQEPLWSAARPGTNALRSLGDLLAEHETWPERLVLEIPMYHVFQIRYMLTVFDLIDAYPPERAMTVLGGAAWTSSRDDASPGDESTVLAMLPEERLAHGGDGTLLLRLRGRASDEPAFVELSGGIFQRRFAWPPERDELVVPLVLHEPTSAALLITGPPELELEEVAVIAELEEAAAREGRLDEARATGTGWRQDVSFSAQTPVPTGAVLLLELDVEGSRGDSLRAFAHVAHGPAIELGEARLRGAAYWAVNTAPIAGERLLTVELRGSTSAPPSPVRRCRLVPPME